ncbi:PfkB family carbohydrate kinase [Nocardioides dongkuii]|uniref:PfkB family carbohydrate kinase n=1 Tax=Nocardioides dongkuii TaxID=2760089 RepID=UPI0015F7F03B|nr:PfkB family carbohydrate kinase [Nocardioides dongkuii]
MDGDVLVVGESLVDVVQRADGSVVEHAGGSAANVAVALARLGRPVRFATAIADDRYGGLVAAHIGRDGVRLAVDPEVVERTASARATLAVDGSASYEFDLEWRLAEVPSDPAPLAVHACSIGAVLEPGAAQVRALLARMRPVATVTYDVNARPAITGTGPDLRAAVEAVVALADLVKASDEDLAALHPGLDPVAAARRLLDLGPAAVVVTRGAEGSSWVARDGVVDVPAVTTEVVDTIGAGDTFGAALLDGLWTRGLLGADRRDDLAAIPDVERLALLQHAARAAALVVGRPGADPPYRNELG